MQRRKMALPLILVLLLPSAGSAKSPAEKVAVGTVRTLTWPLRLLKNTLSLVAQDLGKAVILYLPAVDTDPNRGITAGLLPIFLL